MSKTYGGAGEVLAGELRVTVTPIPMSDWGAVRRLLRREAEAAAADPYTRAKRTLDAIRKADPAAYLEAVRRVADLAATGPAVSDEQVYEYSQSPAGVALQLYYRGRAATPNLTRDVVAAQVTDANADDVLDQLAAIDAAADPKTPAP